MALDFNHFEKLVRGAVAVDLRDVPGVRVAVAQVADDWLVMIEITGVTPLLEERFPCGGDHAAATTFADKLVQRVRGMLARSERARCDPAS
jgi:hypothetical protein